MIVIGEKIGMDPTLRWTYSLVGVVDFVSDVSGSPRPGRASRDQIAIGKIRFGRVEAT